MALESFEGHDLAILRQGPQTNVILFSRYLWKDPFGVMLLATIGVVLRTSFENESATNVDLDFIFIIFRCVGLDANAGIVLRTSINKHNIDVCEGLIEH